MDLNELTELNGTASRGRTLSTVIERLAARRWHVTISVMQPGGRAVDSTVPVVDLGVFRSMRAAKSAAHLVIESWVWEPEVL